MASGIFYRSLLLLALVALGSCNPVVPEQLVPLPGLHFVMDASDLRPARANEFYVLWVRVNQETSFRRAGLLSVNPLQLHGANQIEIQGQLATLDSTQSLVEAMLSVEPDTMGVAPTSIIMRGVNLGANHFDLQSLRDGGIADLRGVTGSAVFLSSTSDTTRILHEFYLMTQSGSVKMPSLTTLPNLNTGWIYSVWVVDSMFYPAHKFFYGAFQHASGHDSDSLNDGFNFPGGYERQLLQPSAGMIEVSVEPLWQLPNLRKIGQSPFPILEGAIPRHIYSGTVVPLSNVSQRGLPHATLMIGN